MGGVRRMPGAGYRVPYKVFLRAPIKCVVYEKMPPVAYWPCLQVARGQPQLASDDGGGDAAPLALRLSGQLLLGVCRIYSRKVVYLLQVGGEARWGERERQEP